MNDAYIDTSIVVAIEFDELNIDVYANQIRQYSKLFSSNFWRRNSRLCVRESNTQRPIERYWELTGNYRGVY